MSGDGVNDALALSQPRIGVAMGAEGAEAAIEAAPVLVEILPGEDSPAASDGAAPPVARHLGGGIERHL